MPRQHLTAVTFSALLISLSLCGDRVLAQVNNWTGDWIVREGHVVFTQTVNTLFDEHVLVNGPGTQIHAINSTTNGCVGYSIRGQGGPNGNLYSDQGGGSPGQWDWSMCGSPWDMNFSDQNRGNLMHLEREGTLHLQGSPYINDVNNRRAQLNPNGGPRTMLEIVRDPAASSGHYIDFMVGNPSVGYTVSAYLDATGFHTNP